MGPSVDREWLEREGAVDPRIEVRHRREAVHAADAIDPGSCLGQLSGSVEIGRAVGLRPADRDDDGLVPTERPRLLW
jgi:hypothetical protein